MDQSFTKFEEEYDVILSECDIEIGRFKTVAEAKETLRKTWGEGRNLEWTPKITEDGRRQLVHEGFTIEAKKII